MQHSIVCGIDDSVSARSAARVAARLARDLDLRLVLAHVTEDRPTFPYGDRRLAEIQRRRAIDDGQRLLADVARGLADVEPETRVALGAPVEGLNDLGRDEAAEIMVVGSRGRGALSAALLGSVSARLASSAERPVIVVPAPEVAERFLERESPADAIVCGVDGSVESRCAHVIAAGLAERMALHLLPVYVDDGTWENAPVGARLHGDHGDPVSGLGRRAMDEDGRLIVVGSRGRGTLRAAVLGSVSRALAVTAPLPVVVVPPTAHPASLLNGGPRGAAHNRAPGLPVDRPTLLRGAAGGGRHVGRFSAGAEQLPDTPSKLHTGRFSEGIEQLPPRELRSRRFSAGIETLPETPSKLRRGSFADGYHAVR